MKKLFCLCLALLLMLSGITVAFAAESAKASVATMGTPQTTTTSSGSSVAVIPDMTFQGPVISLSLDNAYKKMLADSPGAKMAVLNKQSAEGISRGYGESVQTIEDADSSSMYYDSTSKNKLKIMRAFAAEQGPKNYQAEINKLKSDTLKNYFSLKELESQVMIAKNNLALKEKLFENTKLKFKLGTVAKSDVLKAEISVYEAKDQYTQANDGLNTMRMSFNQFIGYGLMQNVLFTDTLKAVDLPTKSLSESVQSALKSRNEIFEVNYNYDLASLDFIQHKAYPANSSKYIAAQMLMLKAETAKTNAPFTVETDVRNKYMAMLQKHSLVEMGKKSVENSQETLRLAQLQYDSGMATLTDVETAQLAFYNTQLSYSKSLLEYNLAVDDYILCSGVGIKTASLQ